MRSVVFDKCLALKVACVTRQAERSVAFGLLSDAEWSLMRDYYDEQRQRPVLETIKIIDSSATSPTEHISRESVLDFGVCVALQYPLTRLLNCFRKRWPFAHREIQFMANVLHAFVVALQKADKPDPLSLVELRMNLLTCHEIIGRRMVGVPEFEKAMRVEHFDQSDYLKFVTIEEVCGTPPLVAA